MLSAFLKALFPCRCAACGELIDGEDFLCEYCHEMIEVCPVDKLCLKCGNLKKNCACSKKIFYFERAAAPFLNKGIARLAMHRYKFRRREQLADFFSKHMALCFKQTMSDIKIDFVCSVPMRKIERFRRGYDHSGLLAEQVAGLLDLRFKKELLRCHKKKRPQHQTDFKERFDNVKGIYYTESRLNGQNVLLVDDIKTTGATLSECAHVLLKAGAGSVYCITGLTTSKTKKGKKNGN